MAQKGKIWDRGHKNNQPYFVQQLKWYLWVVPKYVNI